MPKERGFLRPEEVLTDYLSKLNDPGAYPFTRGIYPTMYREGAGGKKPTLRQFAGHGTAEETNERFKTILALGGTGLSTAFDLPTLMGKDSDDALAEGQVGWDGVAIDTLADMEDLFAGIPLDRTTVSMTINAPAAVVLAMYIAAAEKRGFPRATLGGTTQNDILKEYIAQKEWLFPVEKGVKLVVDTIEFCAREMPKWHPVSVSGYHIREAGSSAVQELAYTLADGAWYVRKTIERGLAPDTFAPRLSFFFDVHNNFFEEIAKLRAARRLWARIMRDQFGARDTKSLWCRIHAQTAGCTLTRKEPINNIVRVAYQALAALLGGVQSIHTNSYDEVICTPTEKALKIAIRTQQILLEETEICNWIDPLGGSWLVESLTDAIEEAALREMDAIEQFGGMEKAIAAYYPQRQIHAEALKDQRRVEDASRKIVGVNCYEDYAEEASDIADIAAELDTRKGFERRQRERLIAVRRGRSADAVKRALNDLKRTAERDENLMPHLLEAVKAYATVGEISKALQSVWGAYREQESTSPRLRRDEIEKITGGAKFKRPVRVVLAKGGLDGHTRGIWILADLFRAMGAEVIYLGLHLSMEEIAKAAIEEGADFVGLSCLIGSPLALFSSLAEKLRAAGRSDIRIIGGGIVLPREQRHLEQELGIGKIFLPDTPFADIVRYLIEEENRRGASPA